MERLAWPKYFKAFSSLGGILGGGAGLSIPAIAYFTQYSPPLLEQWSVLMGAMAGLVVILAFYYPPKKDGEAGKMAPLIKWAYSLLTVAFILLVLYLVVLRIFTVLDPREGKQRFQIGFARAEWSLTEEGRKLKAANPNVSMREFMFLARAYSDERIEVFWKPWTVYLAGLLTILMFMLPFVLWNFGLALIAKQKALS